MYHSSFHIVLHWFSVPDQYEYVPFLFSVCQFKTSATFHATVVVLSLLLNGDFSTSQFVVAAMHIERHWHMHSFFPQNKMTCFVIRYAGRQAEPQEFLAIRHSEWPARTPRMLHPMGFGFVPSQGGITNQVLLASVSEQQEFVPAGGSWFSCSVASTPSHGLVTSYVRGLQNPCLLISGQ